MWWRLRRGHLSVDVQVSLAPCPFQISFGNQGPLTSLTVSIPSQPLGLIFFRSSKIGDPARQLRAPTPTSGSGCQSCSDLCPSSPGTHLPEVAVPYLFCLWEWSHAHKLYRLRYHFLELYPYTWLPLSPPSSSSSSWPVRSLTQPACRSSLLGQEEPLALPQSVEPFASSSSGTHLPLPPAGGMGYDSYTNKSFWLIVHLQMEIRF